MRREQAVLLVQEVQPRCRERVGGRYRVIIRSVENRIYNICRMYGGCVD